MSAATTTNLASRLDAVAERARGKVKAFQTEAEASRHDVQERFQKFLPIAEQIVAIAKEKLEQLRDRLEFEATPAHVQTDHFYSRSVTLDVKSELASVIKFSIKLSHDSDVRLLLLDSNLEIVPIFFQFTPHARLELPLDTYNEAAVGQWLDDRIVDFANTYLELHATKQYQDRVMVSDTVAGVSFPKYFAAATLEHDGKTYYFISEETRREFAKRHGAKA